LAMGITKSSITPTANQLILRMISFISSITSPSIWASLRGSMHSLQAKLRIQ
jgi:hypothetical protein